MPIRRSWQKDLDDPHSLLSVRLRKSVQETCKHPISERHVVRSMTSDTNESYEVHYCEACSAQWNEYPESEHE